MSTTRELITRQNAIRDELARLQDDPETTEEDHADLRDSLIDEYETIKKRLEPVVSRMEKIKAIEQEAGNPDSVESGHDSGSVTRSWGEDRFNGRGPEFMRRLDPFADMEAVRGGFVRSTDLVARAANVIESDDRRHLLPGDRGQETAVKAQNPAVARHILLTGSQDYLEAFRTYLNDPQGAGQVARATLTTATAQAGYLLPYVLDTQIILTNSGSTNPYRRISRVVQTTANAWQGVNSAGVSASWLAEGALAAEAGTAVGQIQIIPQKAAAWVTGSFEAMSDTDYASQLPGMLSDYKDIIEEAAFALGTGGTAGPNAGQPQGVLSGLGTAQRVAAAGGTASGAFSATATGVNDVYNLNAALGPRFRLGPNVAWVANITTINKVRALDQYGGGGFWANLNADQPDRLLGKPVYESPSLNSAGTTATGTALASGVAVFGDFSKYIICDHVGGSTMLFDPMVKSAGTGDAPSGRQGWFYFWRVGGGVAATNAFRWIANST